VGPVLGRKATWGGVCRTRMKDPKGRDMHLAEYSTKEIKVAEGNNLVARSLRRGDGMTVTSQEDLIFGIPEKGNC